MKKAMIAMLILLSGCSSNGDLYTGDKDQEFDLGRTVIMGLGALVLIEAAAHSGSGGSNSVSYRGSSIDDDDWDYLPGSSQYRCRSISDGRFLPNSSCSDDALVDNWY